MNRDPLHSLLQTFLICLAFVIAVTVVSGSLVQVAREDRLAAQADAQRWDAHYRALGAPGKP